MISLLFLNTFITRIFSTILNLILALVIARVLGAAGKGESIFIVTIITCTLYFANLFGNQVLVYTLAKNNFSTVYTISFFWSFFIVAIQYVFISLFFGFNFEYVFHLCLLTFIQSLINLFQITLLAKQKVKTYNFLSILQVFLNVAFLMLLIYGFNRVAISSYIIALYLSSIFTLLCSLYFSYEYLKTYTFKIDIAEVKTMIYTGFQYQLFDFMQFIMLRFSVFLLFRFEGKVSLGIYSIGLSILEAFWIFSRSSATISYVKISNQNNDRYSSLLTLELLKASLIFTLVMIIIFCALPDQVYMFVFGKQYALLKTYMKWQLPGTFMFNIFIVLSAYFSGKGMVYVNLIASSAGAFFAILFGYLLILRYEMSGTAFTSTLAFTSGSIILLLFFHKMNNFKLSDYMIGKIDFILIKKEIKTLYQKK